MRGKRVLKRNNFVNAKNIICIILIIILLSILILTLYLEEKNVSEEVFTPIKAWAQIAPKIDADDAVYIEETESEEVKNLISQIMKDNGLNSSNFGFFFYNINTREYYFYNENKYFTAASTVKVPVAMLYYDKLNVGEITKDDTLFYKSSAYEAGAGAVTLNYRAGSNIPYSVLLEELIVNSDNTANNILIGNIGFDKYRYEIAKYSDRELSSQFYGSNVTCPGYSYDVIKYLYKHSDEYQELIENMKKSSYGKYLKEYLDYDVAHKYGSYNGYVHDYGIIYGKETYLIGVFTKNKNDAPTLIANIGKQVVDLVESNENNE